MKEFDFVRKDVPRVDAVDKATGMPNSPWILPCLTCSLANSCGAPIPMPES